MIGINGLTKKQIVLVSILLALAADLKISLIFGAGLVFIDKVEQRLRKEDAEETGVQGERIP